MNDFKFSEVEDFDRHIDLSIPNYDLLFKQVTETIDSLDSRGGQILDLGCSTGKLLKTLKSESPKIGIDQSDLIPESETGLSFMKVDVLDYEYGVDNFSTIISLFFLQFLTRRERGVMLGIIKESLRKGGRFYCAEKIHYDDSLLDSVTKEIHLQGKREHFSDTDILDKSDQLMRSMWLSTDSELRAELSEIGKVTEIWRSYTFCGYVVTK
jgi:tRNA (cmo5U34)-methyltransferase